MKELVDLLVKAGVEKKEAEEKVKKVVETIRKVRPKETDERIMAIAKLQVLQYVNAIKRGNAKVVRGTVIGYSDYRDVLAGIKSAVLSEYQKDPQKALMEGLVRISDDGTVVPLDNRATLQSGEPNPNFGKPIGSIFRRDIWMVIDGQIKHVFGNVKDEPKIGGVYTFAGIDREDGTMFVSRLKQFTQVGEEKDLWTTVEKAAKPVKDVKEGLDKPFVVYRGMATFVTETVTENLLIVLDDINNPTGEGIAVFIPPERVDSQPFVGAEIIVIGRASVNQERVIINGYGAVVNPNSLSIVPEVDEILWQ